MYLIEDNKMQKDLSTLTELQNSLTWARTLGVFCTIYTQQ